MSDSSDSQKSRVVVRIVVHRNYILWGLFCLHWVFLRMVFTAKFYLHQCWSPASFSYMFEMFSVDWYVTNRIMHVHPVSDGNSQCRLSSARHLAMTRVSPAQSASWVTVQHRMNVPDSLHPICWTTRLHCFMSIWTMSNIIPSSWPLSGGLYCTHKRTSLKSPPWQYPVGVPTFKISKISLHGLWQTTLCKFLFQLSTCQESMQG